ncbi:MAG: CCA tRNA nucleotidyltransferase [Lachnospiraceae bacterium]
MTILLPANVKKIIRTLNAAGHEAYAVGGCVRDSILGRQPEDWDITTSATPEQTKALFKRTFDTGIEHGTITVLLDKQGYEVTTYRIDGKYQDSRHPSNVEFTRSLEEDLLRRDFTINAMAYNEEQGLKDIFGGRQDLESGIVRCVGNAKQRFGEDALRILRAVRFSAQLGFTVEGKTKTAIRELAPTLANISAERIQVELVKLLISPHPEKVTDLYELGITDVILPEFNPMMTTEQETVHHMYNVGIHTIEALKAIRADRILRLTMLFHDIGKPEMKTIDAQGVAHFKKHAQVSETIASQVLKRLKFDNDTIYKVTRLVRYHDYRMPAKANLVRRAMNKIGVDLFPYYLEARRADTLAQSEFERSYKLQNIDEVTELYQMILDKQQCVSLNDLAITGRDLLELGMKQGAGIGEMLKTLLNEVIEEPELNQKERLLRRVKELIES